MNEISRQERTTAESTDGLASMRKLEPDDWALFKELRMEALEKEPSVFNPSSDESLMSDEEWQEKLRRADLAAFLLSLGETPAGITGVVADQRDPEGRTGLLVMSYLRPEYRGQKLSRYFYETRIDWARQSTDFQKLVVGHREDNLASKSAMSRYGFGFVSEEDNTWPDGTRGKLLEYELLL